MVISSLTADPLGIRWSCARHKKNISYFVLQKICGNSPSKYSDLIPNIVFPNVSFKSLIYIFHTRRRILQVICGISRSKKKKKTFGGGTRLTDTVHLLRKSPAKSILSVSKTTCNLASQTLSNSLST